jgi:signal transduction histidine kinase
MIVEPFPELFVACDVGTLTSVLENLLQNALKYTRDCDLRRIAVRASRGCGVVRIEIEDTGPGIPPGIIDRIFEPYVRVGGCQQVGLGLGLATVKRFCEACGGSVRVHSTVGVGCTFTVELPEATEAKEAKEAKEATDAYYPESPISNHHVVRLHHDGAA